MKFYKNLRSPSFILLTSQSGCIVDNGYSATKINLSSHFEQTTSNPLGYLEEFDNQLLKINIPRILLSNDGH